MKTLRCRDVGFPCSVVIRAETEEEILRKAAEHVKTVHYLSEISEQAVEKMCAMIRVERHTRAKSHRSRQNGGR